MLSAALGRVTPQNDANTFVENTLRSLSSCGTGSIDLWTAPFQVLMVMKAGPSTMVESLHSAVLVTSAIQWHRVVSVGVQGFLQHP